jgi:hypothetical protein
MTIFTQYRRIASPNFGDLLTRPFKHQNRLQGRDLGHVVVQPLIHQWSYPMKITGKRDLANHPAPFRGVSQCQTCPFRGLKNWHGEKIWLEMKLVQ